MDKNMLRKKYKKLRSELDVSTIEGLSMRIANQLLDLDIWKSNNYHIFLPISKQKEVDTEFILHILQGKDKNVVLSKTDFKSNSLSHYLLTDTTIIKENKYGIPEPTGGISITEETIDVVFVPLLAFDTLGNRVGYGKGFYDRFISKCRHDVVKIGLSFFAPEPKIIDILNSDIPLNYCITPEKAYAFNNS